MFAPCDESNSWMVLILRARGSEHPGTAVRSPHGVSIQPDIPISVSLAPPSRDGGFLAHAQVQPLHAAFREL